jgi:hypothetical protein
MNQDKIIYESPDGGDTIYARPFGSTERKLHIQNPRSYDLHEQLMEQKLWGEIHRAAKTNPTLQKCLDRAILVYKLSKNYEQNNIK